MEAKKKASQDAPAATFVRFSELPVEIQLHIWEMILHDSTFVRIEWTTPTQVTTSWHVTPIPQLGEGEEPGLIPYTLPAGLPATFSAFPRPWGFPNPQLREAIDWNPYNLRNYATLLNGIYNGAAFPENGRFSFKKAYTHIADKIAGSTGKPQRDTSPNVAQSQTQNACFSVCRASREQALKHAIIDTQQLLQPSKIQNVGGGGSRLYPVRAGFVLGSIFKDQQNNRPCVIFALEPNKAGTIHVGRDSHVAARLADIERCIFGHRLSLTELTEGMDEDQFEKLSWAMWWRPELGSRVRRPEANHPFHCPPKDILWIYSMVLHQLVAAPAEQYPLLPGCLAGNRGRSYATGTWYSHLVETGQCVYCTRPLVQELRCWFPQLLDANGQIDIVILRDRKTVEEPEVTMVHRSHEFII